MADSLKVIALISGGKDSFYSLLHCLQNGHQIVALGNLYPPKPPQSSRDDFSSSSSSAPEETEHDLASFMYQTVGHTVIPLYEQALGIPLYRQQISGSAVQTGTSYHAAHLETDEDAHEDKHEEDETESLVPLLRKIMAAHPEANALSTGAILSTYQRTRIESIAVRLNLVPLSYLWQYPSLPPHTQISLLQDMQAVGLDARLIKVASGGLDESFLWGNVASVKGMTRVERAMQRFSCNTDGAVIGEGGEFETLVIDGPQELFKGRIVIIDGERRIVREGGGAAWLSIEGARVEMKDVSDELQQRTGEVRVPDILDVGFAETLLMLSKREAALRQDAQDRTNEAALNTQDSKGQAGASGRSRENLWMMAEGGTPQTNTHWTFTGHGNILSQSVNSLDLVQLEMESIAEQIHASLSGIPGDSGSRHILFAVILLRSMDHFGAVNKVGTCILFINLIMKDC